MISGTRQSGVRSSEGVVCPSPKSKCEIVKCERGSGPLIPRKSGPSIWSRRTRNFGYRKKGNTRFFAIPRREIPKSGAANSREMRTRDTTVVKFEGRVSGKQCKPFLRQREVRSQEEDLSRWLRAIEDR
jgi:hypothetical protein